MPADTTMVGIPARPVDRGPVNRAIRRDRGAPSFDPYGMPCDDSLDPVACELESLRAEIAELEARIGRIAQSRSSETRSEEARSVRA